MSITALTLSIIDGHDGNGKKLGLELVVSCLPFRRLGGRTGTVVVQARGWVESGGDQFQRLQYPANK